MKYNKISYSDLILGELSNKIIRNNLIQIDYDAYVLDRETHNFLLDISYDIGTKSSFMNDTYGFKTLQKGVSYLYERKLIKFKSIKNIFENSIVTYIVLIDDIDYEPWIKAYKRACIVDKIKKYC